MVENVATRRKGTRTVKSILTMTIVLLAGLSSAQQKPVRQENVVAKVDPALILTEKVRNAPHVCYVNVGNALDEKAFRQVVASVATVLPINLAVAKADAAPVPNCLTSEKSDMRFGKEARLLVYVVNNPKMVRFASVPEQWALVNVNGVETGIATNDSGRVETRLTKMMLKGLAFAAGVGSNMESTRCVMGFGSFLTWEGLDKTSASFSPFAGIPLMETLTPMGVVLTGLTPEE